MLSFAKYILGIWAEIWKSQGQTVQKLDLPQMISSSCPNQLFAPPKFIKETRNNDL